MDVINKGPVTSDTKPKKKSRQSSYADRQKAKGLKQISKWVPEGVYDDLMLMMEICSENRELIPHTVRSLKTGRMKGINS